MVSEKCNNLFVYGSLRSGFKSPAYDYISRFFSFVGEAKVQGKLFDLGPYPAGVPGNNENFIVGELYAIRNDPEFNWAMGQLDDYEGTSGGEVDEVSLYKRELVNVFINDTTVPAWIYWYTGNVGDKPLIKSGDMIQYLQEKNNPGATLPQ
jgi:gamma-glutamylcyclotransferase (GGCT)/AIG2-like uncharacterized protein YtfP